MCSLEFNPNTYTMVSGLKNRKVSYWDLETFQSISESPYLSSIPSIIHFYDSNQSNFPSNEEQDSVEWIVAGSGKKFSCLNVETFEFGESFSLPESISDLSFDLRHNRILALTEGSASLKLFEIPIPKMSVHGESGDVEMQIVGSEPLVNR